MAANDVGMADCGVKARIGVLDRRPRRHVVWRRGRSLFTYEQVSYDVAGEAPESV
jgi:hypothetical protein